MTPKTVVTEILDCLREGLEITFRRTLGNIELEIKSAEENFTVRHFGSNPQFIQQALEECREMFVKQKEINRGT